MIEEALCFGWIDGQLGGIDDGSHAIHFTKRRAGSIWSKVNVARMERLTANGLVAPAWMQTFEARTPEGAGVYSFEMERVEFSDELEAEFSATPDAWEFWMKQPCGYRRQMTRWMTSAKRNDTRRRRLGVLIGEHGAGRRIDPVHLPKLTAVRAEGTTS